MTTEEKIEELENSCRTAMAEIEKLKTELAEKDKNETVWIPKRGEIFLSIYANGINKEHKYDDFFDYHNQLIRMNNAFEPTVECKKHLEWYRDNILRIQNKLMQLHELLCPDYFPDLNTNEDKWTVYYNTKHKCFSCIRYNYNHLVVCFTKEAAEKACEILNREDL